MDVLKIQVWLVMLLISATVWVAIFRGIFG